MRRPPTTTRRCRLSGRGTTGVVEVGMEGEGILPVEVDTGTLDSGRTRNEEGRWKHEIVNELSRMQFVRRVCRSTGTGK